MRNRLLRFICMGCVLLAAVFLAHDRVEDVLLVALSLLLAYLWLAQDLAFHARIERALRESEDRLRRSKDELESLVRERTAELRRAYEATALRERELKSLLDHLPDYIVRADRDLRYTYVSPAIAAVTGIPIEGLVGRLRSEVRLPADYLEKADALLHRALESRREARGEVVFWTPAGPRYFDAIVVPELAPDGSLESVLGVSRDITELKQAEQRAGLLQSVAQTVHEARDYPSALEGILRTVCRTFGWPMGEIWVPTADGKHLEYGAVWSSDPARFKDFIEAGRAKLGGPGSGFPGRAWQEGRPVWMDEIPSGPGLSRVEAARKSGLRAALAVPVFTERRIALVMTFGSFRPRRWGEDPVVGIIQAVAQQMGGYILRKRAEDERERLRREFLEAQRLEAVGRLAGGVAHDFANILSAVVGTSELMLSRLDPGDPEYDDLQLIKSSSMHGVGLIRQLLAIGRGRTVEAGSWSLNEILSGMEHMLGRVLGEGIRLRLRLDEYLWAVDSDKAHLEQVVMNLVVNARDAMPEGGDLVIETENRMLGSKALSLGLMPGEYVRLSVGDSGMGMSPEVLARIFEPFYTTKAPGAGTGLGLATVHHIMTLAGGRIDVDSRPGEGSTFTLYFPRAGKTVGEQASPEARVPRRDWRRGDETLLLVEDDDVVRGIARQVLKKAGYAVLQASSAEEALRLSKEHGGRIQLLLADIQLPGMSGFDLAVEFERSYPRIPVAFLSGFSREEIEPEARAIEGAAVVISKPFTLKSLLKGVRKALDQPVGAAR